ncbi:MAG: hypothetical protein R2795_14520 [Saprospiraceae bacterium]
MQKNKSIDTNQPISSRYRFFMMAVGFLTLAQLLTGLDYVTIWPGGEALLMQQSALWKAPTGLLAPWVLGNIPLTSDYWLLAYRLPGVLLFLLGWGMWIWRGRALFGADAVRTTSLFLGAAFLPAVLAKEASLDIWRMGAELTFWLSLLHYMKKPGSSAMGWLLLTGLLAGF